MRSVSWLAALTVAVVGLATPRFATADTGALPGGNTLMFTPSKEFYFEIANPDSSGGTVGQPPFKEPNSSYYYFNYAHCECASPKWINTSSVNSSATDPGHKETKLSWLVQLSGIEATHLPLQIWTGTGCDDPNTVTRTMNCSQIGAIADDDSLFPGGSQEEFNLYDVMTPEPANRTSGECLQRVFTPVVWLAASSSQGSTLDYWLSQKLPTSTYSTADSQAPFSPSAFSVSSGEGAIDLSWTVNADNQTDIAYYQAMCVADDDPATPVTATPAADPLYQTPYSLCGADVNFCFAAINPTVNEGTSSDGGVDAEVDVDAATTTTDGGGTCAVVPDAIAHLEKSFICGSSSSATATSLRIGGLTNGAHYHVALLTIDKSGNASGVWLNHSFVPVPSTDFWEDLHGRGSKVEGGFCLMNDTFGDDSGISTELRAFRDDTLAATAFGRWLTTVYYDEVAPYGQFVQGSALRKTVTAIVCAPAILVAVAWHHLTLPGLLALLAVAGLAFNRRRILARRGVRVALAGAATVAALVVAPHPAHAQVDPYWEHADSTSDPEPQEAIAPVKWFAGIRVGPYTPAIDAQLGGPSPGPYKQMFGGWTVLPMLDVQRVVWRGLGGQWLVGGAVGYLGKSANAFSVTSMPTDPNRARTGDTNSFKLIPLEAIVSYRFTYLDDELGVPIVPYARGGLSYDAWWVTAPDGNFSKVCKGTGTEPDCTQNKARGASAGLNLALGLAIRAERIDQGAAATMRDSGILHAGFYVEVSAAKVDGFGSDTKLSVGDNTFFGGVNFEF